jgi:hypothetical protein
LCRKPTHYISMSTFHYSLWIIHCESCTSASLKDKKVLNSAYLCLRECCLADRTFSNMISRAIPSWDPPSHRFWAPVCIEGTGSHWSKFLRSPELDGMQQSCLKLLYQELSDLFMFK